MTQKKKFVVVFSGCEIDDGTSFGTGATVEEAVQYLNGSVGLSTGDEVEVYELPAPKKFIYKQQENFTLEPVLPAAKKTAAKAVKK